MSSPSHPSKRKDVLAVDPPVPSSPVQQQSQVLDDGSRECEPSNASRGPCEEPPVPLLYSFSSRGREKEASRPAIHKPLLHPAARLFRDPPLRQVGVLLHDGLQPIVEHGSRTIQVAGFLNVLRRPDGANEVGMKRLPCVAVDRLFHERTDRVYLIGEDIRYCSNTEIMPSKVPYSLCKLSTTSFSALLLLQKSTE